MAIMPCNNIKEITMKNVAVHSIDEYFTAIVAITRTFNNAKPWWRGHADSEWRLVPSLYHKNKALAESNMSVRFMTQAIVRHQTLPAFDDYGNWLFIMQHYGLPTRLLDWTQSPLIALYFAVAEEDQKERDGMVWGLHPTLLNQHNAGQKKIIHTNSRDAQTLVKDAFDNKSKHDKNISLAIVSRQIDLRQMVQLAECTIHGSSKSLQEYEDAEKYLVGISVPSKSKQYFRQAIDLLGISEATIFPDLDHLAKELQSIEYILDADT